MHLIAEAHRMLDPDFLACAPAEAEPTRYRELAYRLRAAAAAEPQSPLGPERQALAAALEAAAEPPPGWWGQSAQG